MSAGLELAQRHQARVRGVTLEDTRRLEALSACETGAYLVAEHSHLARTRLRQRAARAELSQACLARELDFDMRSFSGDPYVCLPAEARFHDLIIASCCSATKREPAGLAPRDWIELLHRGVQPLLIVHEWGAATRRVLLVYDGTAAASRAIRSYLAQGLFPDAQHRLLVTGAEEAHAKECLRQFADDCRLHGLKIESGWTRQRRRRVLVPYAQKWEADLIVMGVERGNDLLRRFVNEPAALLRRLTCHWYLLS
jgi:nucleotide-binding universal stress UspA family protein